MISILALGSGHRVWWTLYLERRAFAIGRGDGLREWAATMLGDRVNRHGILENVTHRIIGWVCIAWWTRSSTGVMR